MKSFGIKGVISTEDEEDACSVLGRLYPLLRGESRFSTNVFLPKTIIESVFITKVTYFFKI